MSAVAFNTSIGPMSHCQHSFSDFLQVVFYFHERIFNSPHAKFVVMQVEFCKLDFLNGPTSKNRMALDLDSWVAIQYQIQVQ